VWSIVSLEVGHLARHGRQVIPAPTGRVLLPTYRTGTGTSTECASAFGASSISEAGPAPHTLGQRACASTRARGEAAIAAGADGPRLRANADPQGRGPEGHDRQGDGHARNLGQAPHRRLGPGLTFETPELLAEAGVKYIGDWVYDDEPTVIATAKGPLVTLPYSVELNDIPMMLVQHHEAEHWYRRCADAFDRLYAEGASRPKIMAIAVHPYISGQPFRINYLERVYDYINRYSGVLHWNGAEIYDWYNRSAKVHGG
jgi:hypothetical protein